MLETLVEPAGEPEGRCSQHLALALAGIGIAALIGAAALVSGSLFGGGNAEGTPGAMGGDDGTAGFVPDTARRQRAPFPAEREPSALPPS